MTESLRPTLSLAALNAASAEQFTELLAGTYEHSPWIAERAHAHAPFASIAALRQALIDAVRNAGRDAQLALIRAHPELVGTAMLRNTLTAESSHEQNTAGLTHCSPKEFARIQELNAAYNAKFGWPFIVAVRGPRGLGLTRTEIISLFERRLQGTAEFEFAEALRNIHRIAEMRLADKFAQHPVRGQQVWDWAEALAVHSDAAETGDLTVTYLTPAHRAVSAQLQAWMRECGFDEVTRDAVGNVVGVYYADASHGGAGARRLLTGSHFDTVRKAGKYDGRLGILVPMLLVQGLHRAGRRLPFGVEVVGFSEEEGQRYAATFLGSGALVGQFRPEWLEQTDANGISMRQAMRAAGLSAELEDIAALCRDPAQYLGFVEVHIEQGPVLNASDLPLGVVTSINGSVRYVGEVQGVASHAGTTPMGQRRDAALAVAELALFVEQRASAVPDVVGTVGQFEVPSGSINVVPGRCRFSLDLRATHDAARDALATDVCAELDRICARRGLQYRLQRTLVASAAPSHPAWQARWEAAVAALGLPVYHLPSGAGHDAMKLHEALPQAMLFVRGGNAGISHNPLETITDEDAELAVAAFEAFVNQLAKEASDA